MIHPIIIFLLIYTTECENVLPKCTQDKTNKNEQFSFLLPSLSPRFLIRRHKDALAVEVLKKTHQIPHDVALLEVDIIAKAVKKDNVKKRHIVAATVHSFLKWDVTVR